MRTCSRLTRIAVGSVSGGVASVWGLAMRVSAQVQTTQFVDLAKAPPPEFSPAPLLYGAYAFVWAALVVYVLTLWRRLGRVERELQDVGAKLAARR
jgi:CcmD family protein